MMKHNKARQERLRGMLDGLNAARKQAAEAPVNMEVPPVMSPDHVMVSTVIVEEGKKKKAKGK